VTFIATILPTSLADASPPAALPYSFEADLTQTTLHCGTQIQAEWNDATSTYGFDNNQLQAADAIFVDPGTGELTYAGSHLADASELVPGAILTNNTVYAGTSTFVIHKTEWCGWDSGRIERMYAYGLGWGCMMDMIYSVLAFFWNPFHGALRGIMR